MANKSWASLMGLGMLLLGGCAADSINEAAPMPTFEDHGRVVWKGNAHASTETAAIVSALDAAGVSPLRAAAHEEDLAAWGLNIVDRHNDEAGNVHIKLSQRVGGLAVEGAGLTASLNGGHVYALMGRHLQGAGARTAHPLQWADAIDASLTRFALTRGELSAAPEVTPLLQWEGGRLVSRLRVDLRTDLTLPRVYLDAVTGDITMAYDRMHAQASHANGPALATDEHAEHSVPLNTWFENDTYYMRDASRNNGRDDARTIRTFDVDQCGTGTSLCGGEARSETNTWPEAHNNSAHFLTGQVMDFWMERYGLDSYDGRGANIRVFQMQGSGYDNAYWNGMDSIIIGDGSYTGSGGYYDYLSRGDIIAHELGHAVEGAMGPDLLYRQESGALAEATADMTAAYFERWYEAQHYGSDSADWLIAEDAVHDSSAYPYRAMRNMSDPSEMGDADTWRGARWVNTEGCTPNASNDNCGVHSNSGPANFAFYLQTEGGAGTNDHGYDYDVEAIGIEDAHAIMFQAVRYHLNETSGYQDYYDALTVSAEELFGADSAQASCVEESLHAVGLRVCGNNACETGETEDSCSQDCQGFEPTPEPTPAPTPEPEASAFTTFVSNISVSQRAKSRFVYDVLSTIDVRQVSEFGVETQAAGVWVTMSIEDGRGDVRVVEGSTDHEGKLTVAEYKVIRGETLRVCVLDVDSGLSPYDANLNVESCETYRVSR